MEEFKEEVWRVYNMMEFLDDNIFMDWMGIVVG